MKVQVRAGSERCVQQTQVSTKRPTVSSAQVTKTVGASQAMWERGGDVSSGCHYW